MADLHTLNRLLGEVPATPSPSATLDANEQSIAKAIAHAIADHCPIGPVPHHEVGLKDLGWLSVRLQADLETICHASPELLTLADALSYWQQSRHPGNPAEAREYLLGCALECLCYLEPG